MRVRLPPPAPALRSFPGSRHVSLLFDVVPLPSTRAASVADNRSGDPVFIPAQAEATGMRYRSKIFTLPDEVSTVDLTAPEPPEKLR